MAFGLLIFGTIFAFLAYYKFEYTNFGIPRPPPILNKKIELKNINDSIVFTKSIPPELSPIPKIRTISKIKSKKSNEIYRQNFITRL